MLALSLRMSTNSPSSVVCDRCGIALPNSSTVLESNSLKSWHWSSWDGVYYEAAFAGSSPARSSGEGVVREMILPRYCTLTKWGMKFRRLMPVPSRAGWLPSCWCAPVFLGIEMEISPFSFPLNCIKLAVVLREVFFERSSPFPSVWMLRVTAAARAGRSMLPSATIKTVLLTTYRSLTHEICYLWCLAGEVWNGFLGHE